MSRPNKAIELSREETEQLEAIAGSREASYGLVQRAEIILRAAGGESSRKLSQELRLCENMVGMWRKRWVEGSAQLRQVSGNARKLNKAIKELLTDRKRSGSPCHFSADLVQNKFAKSLHWRVNLRLRH